MFLSPLGTQCSSLFLTQRQGLQHHVQTNPNKSTERPCDINLDSNTVAFTYVLDLPYCQGQNFHNTISLKRWFYTSLQPSFVLCHQSNKVYTSSRVYVWSFFNEHMTISIRWKEMNHCGRNRVCLNSCSNLGVIKINMLNLQKENPLPTFKTLVNFRILNKLRKNLFCALHFAHHIIFIANYT